MKFLNRTSLFLTLLLFMSVQVCLAETKYVTDLMEITMRTGKGVGRKIIAMLQSGEKVRVLESYDDWSLVKNSEGKQGWVLTRFLTGSEPKSSLLEKLRNQHEKLSEQAKNLREENDSLKTENKMLKSDLKTKKDSLEELSVSYKTLKEESAEYMELKTREKEARSKVKQLSEKADRLEKEVSRLRTKQSIRWFLAGAGVLFFGFLIGLMSRKKRRRSSLL